MNSFYLITKLLENAATHGARGVFGPQVIDDEKRPDAGVKKLLDLGIHLPILQEDHGNTGLHVAVADQTVRAAGVENVLAIFAGSQE